MIQSLVDFIVIGTALGRELSFPPISGVQVPFSVAVQYESDTGMDLSTGLFAGLMTYANLPYVHCLAADGEEIEQYDIAIVGAPFDTAVTARPGARFGPTGIREGSRRISPQFSYSVYTGRNYFQEWAKIVDCTMITYQQNTQVTMSIFTNDSD